MSHTSRWLGFLLLLLIAACESDTERAIRNLETHSGESARVKAIGFLTTNGDTKAIAPLVAALRDRNLVVRASAAEALAEMSWLYASDADSAAFLVATRDWSACLDKGAEVEKLLMEDLEHTDDDYVLEIISTLVSLRCEAAVDPIKIKIKDLHPSRIRDTFFGIARIGGERSREITARQIKLHEMDSLYVTRLLAIQGNYELAAEYLARYYLESPTEYDFHYSKIYNPLVEMGVDIAPTVILLFERPASNSDERLIKTRSAETIRRIGHPFQNLLIEMTKDPSLETRHFAYSVLESCGDEEVIPLFHRSLGSKDIFLFRSAIEGLRRLEALNDENIVRQLLALLDQDWSRGGSWPIKSLLESGHPSVVPGLLTVLESGTLQARTNAVIALGRTGEASVLDPVLGAIKAGRVNDSEIIIAALRKLGDPRGATGLVPYLDYSAHKGWVSKTAAAALVDLDWTPANDRERVRFWYAKNDLETMANNWVTTKAVLLSGVESPNYTMFHSSLMILIGLGNEDAIPDLSANLFRRGTVEIAQAYLNCGHERLEQQGRSWANANGYTVKKGYGGCNVQWGSMKK